jgi:tetratricopeptide (TPR) repeat protein
MNKPDLAALAAREALTHAHVMNRPRDYAALNHLAAWLEMLTGEFEASEISARLDAAEATLEALGAQDELVRIKATRAQLIAQTEGVESASALFEEAIAQMHPDQHTDKAINLTILGELLNEQGHAEQAISALHRAVDELSQTDNQAQTAQAWQRLGCAYENVGLIEVALQCMKRATENLNSKPTQSASKVSNSTS